MILCLFCLAMCQAEAFLDLSTRYFTKAVPNLAMQFSPRNITHKYSTNVAYRFGLMSSKRDINRCNNSIVFLHLSPKEKRCIVGKVPYG
jgi:hypothetical protein